MRQIKKLVALVLALVMSLSLAVTVNAGATGTGPSNLEIASGKAYTITGEAKYKNVTIEDGATLTVSKNGDLTVENKLTEDGELYIAGDISAKDVAIGPKADVSFTNASATMKTTGDVVIESANVVGVAGTEKALTTTGSLKVTSEAVKAAVDKVTEGTATVDPNAAKKTYTVKLDKTSPAVNEEITATVTDNTGTKITEGVTYSWKVGDTTISNTTATYTVKEADAGKTITVSAKVGDVEATSAELTVAGAEEAEGPFDLTASYTAGTKPSDFTGSETGTITTTDDDGVETITTKKADAIEEGEDLTFVVESKLGYTPKTFKVTVGGKDVTSTVEATKTAVDATHNSYKIAKVSGDVVITLEATKNATYDLAINANLSQTSVVAATGGTLTAVTAKKYTDANDITYNVYEVLAGDTVTITADTVGDTLTDGDTVKVADDVYATVGGTHKTLTISDFPAKKVVIKAYSAAVLYSVKAGAGITLSDWVAHGTTNKVTPEETDGVYYVPANTDVKVTVDTTKATGWFFTETAGTNVLAASVGTGTAKDKLNTGTTAAIGTANVEIYAYGLIQAKTGVTLKYTNGAGETQTLTADAKSAMAIDAAPVATATSGSGTAVIAKTAADDTELSTISSKLQTGNKAASVTLSNGGKITYLVPAVKVDLTGVDGYLYGETIGAYVEATSTASTLGVDTKANAIAGASNNKLYLVVTDGTTPATVESGKVYGKLFSATTIGAKDLSVAGTVAITGEADVKVAAGGATLAAQLSAVSAALSGTPKTLYIVPDTVLTLTASAADKELGLVPSTQKLTGPTVVDERNQYTYTAGKVNVTVTETDAASDETVAVTVTGYGTANMDLTTIAGLTDAASFDTAFLDGAIVDAGRGGYVKIGDDYMTWDNAIAALKGKIGGESITMDVGYYKVTAETTGTGTAIAGITIAKTSLALSKEYVKLNEEFTAQLVLGADAGTATGNGVTGTVTCDKTATISGTTNVPVDATAGAKGNKITLKVTEVSSGTDVTFTCTLTATAGG